MCVAKYWRGISSLYSVGNFYVYVPRPYGWLAHSCGQTLCSRVCTQTNTTAHNLSSIDFPQMSLVLSLSSVPWCDVALLLLSLDSRYILSCSFNSCLSVFTLASSRSCIFYPEENGWAPSASPLCYGQPPHHQSSHWSTFKVTAVFP